VIYGVKHNRFRVSFVEEAFLESVLVLLMGDGESSFVVRVLFEYLYYYDCFFLS
jgi:hypothetical protein